jgi:hypothetical protein
MSDLQWNITIQSSNLNTVIYGGNKITGYESDIII